MDTANATPELLPTVVLCCERDARHLLAPVLELLTSRGFAVEVVSGLEQRDDGLMVAAARQRDTAYVLFACAESNILERATAKLRQAGVAPRRIAAMPLDWRGPADVASAIEAMGIPMPRGPRRATMTVPPTTGTVVSFPPPMSLGAAAIPTPNPEPRHPLHSQSVPVLQGDDLGDAPWVRGRRRAVVAGAALVGALFLTIAIAAGSGPDDAAAPTPWSTLAGMPAPAAEIRVAGIVGAEPRTPAPELVMPPTPATPAVAAPVPVPVVAPPVIVAPPAVAPPAVAPPAVVAAPASPVAAAAPAVPGEEPTIEDTPEIDEAEMRTIYAGLTGQKFRALDIVLVAPEPRKRVRKRITKAPAKLNWAQADAYCNALELGGVAGWRLPRVGELGSLTRGALIGEGKFWSQTEGDTFGRSRVVWNTQTEKMGTAPVSWKGGRVVCVRTMARPAPTPEPK